MKTVKIETTEIPLNGQMMTYRDLIKNTLNHPPPNGFSFDDMSKRSRIEKAMNENPDSDEFELEDQDASNLKQITDVMRWGIRHPDLIAFVQAIKDL